MIESITLEGFQSHAQTELEFGPGLNVIVGRSDSGKSAILRGLRWAAQNRPRGVAFMGWDASRAYVKIVSSRGTVERLRARKGGQNGYLLGDAFLEATGTSVPPQVQDVLGLDPINCQWQHDAPYLVSESSGEVARRLNDIAGIGDIDAVQAELNRRMRDTVRKEQEQVIALDRIKHDLEPYEKLDAAMHAAREARKTEDKLAQVSERLEAARALRLKIGAAKEKLTACKQRDTAKLTAAIVEYERLHKAEEKAGTLLESARDLLDDMENVSRKLKGIPEQLAKLRTEEKRLMGDACPLCGQKYRN